MASDQQNHLKVAAWKRYLNWLFIRSEGLIGKWRRRLKTDPETYFFVSEPIKQANAFAGKLYPDDEFYFQTRYAWVSPEDAKKLFLYGCARQVIKATVVLIENEDFVQELPKNDDTDVLGRAIIESIIDAQHVILRRHLELLANLIGFSQSDRGNEAFRIFLNAESLDYFLGRQADFCEFFENRSANYDSSLSTFSKRIDEDIKALKTTPWFLRENWKDLVKQTHPSVFTSARTRIMSAIPYATADEKIMFGMSYEFFSQFSAAAHAAAGSRFDERHYRPKTIKGNIAMISMTGLHIISRLNRLMGFDDPSDFQTRMAGKSVSPELIKRWSREFEVGDIVFAMDDVAEVTAFKKSKYGYTSVKIRFLTRPPLPETPEDALPCAFVAMVMPKRKVREFLFKNKGKPTTPIRLREALVEMEKETDNTLLKCARAAFVELHKNGILIPWLLQSGVIQRKKSEDW
ncbi:hypothetical protein C4587_01545 [Candidatus Parcubacteria bacterium]|nr:MAG: hypothetical protein C4587_01545 [Candidatus Parcubacteria bacterium]